jgi:putative ABC transport system permease protein
MARRPWYERLYRALLRILPSEFRSDFEESMTEDFRDQRADAVAKGDARSMRRLWWQTFTGLFRVAPREHLSLLRRDVGYAWRLLRRRPAFAASTILTLAVGIGLNTAVFSVVHGILLQRLPMPGSERLVRLYEVNPERKEGAVSGENVMDWRAQSKTLDKLALIGFSSGTLSGDGAPEQVRGMAVSEDFFPMIGAAPLLGRLFVESDYAAWNAARVSKTRNWPQPTVAILSETLWTRRFGGRADVIGKTITLSRTPVEVIGVIRPADSRFFGSDPAEYWVPGGAQSNIARRARFLDAVGRLAPGVSLEQAQAELDVIANALAVKYPEANKDWTLRAISLQQDTSASVRQQLWFLLGAAACVLIIACANVANLVLAHAAGRRHELATRIALGASRRVLVRQALTEGLVIGLAGGVAGFLLAFAAVPVLVTLAPADTPRLGEVVVNSRMFIFALVVSVAAGLACGLAACLSLDRANPKTAFRQAGAGGVPRGRPFRYVLTVTQVALALMLTVASGLLVRTMRAVEALELGFEPDRVLAIGISPDFRKYGSLTAIQQFNARLLERLKAHPGIAAAGVGSRPLAGGSPTNLVNVIGGTPDGLHMGVDATSPGYFPALGLSLTAGRLFTDADSEQAAGVVIVNERAARDLGISDAPLGRTLEIDKTPMQVVGVVADSRRGALEATPAPAVYRPFLQNRTTSSGQLLIRTSGDPRAIVGDVRAIVAELDPELALTRIQTLDERLGESMAPRRFILRLVGLFSILALGLAMIGLYGVIAESVAQRVPEIGVRMALGAAPFDILRLVMTQGGWLVAVGISLGIGGAIALRDSMSSFVFGVPTSDPLSFVVAAVSLLAATLIACLVPARRAAAVDPVIALRQD